MIRIIAFIFISFIILSCDSDFNSGSKKMNRLPAIFPDYTKLVIPQNIAPLNFAIEEEGKSFIVRFSGNGNKGFQIKSGSPVITIPQKKWIRLLQDNIGKKINIEVFVKGENDEWSVFDPFSDSIVSDKIDKYIVFRRINTSLLYWNDMSIVQRDIETYHENYIANNKNFKNGCINCHSFGNHNSENFLLHFRRDPSGTLIFSQGKAHWLNTSNKYTLSGFVYPSWHPKGKLIAFSTNKINQDFYGSGHRINYVRDVASDIVIYDIEKKMISTSPEIATKDFENLPNWSPDGKYLYFTRCSKEMKSLPDTLVKYDLLRIPFDENTREWGKSEILISSAETNKSVSFPEVSPDGKFVVFCMADYGYFTIGNPTSDLYIMDLSTLQYRKLNINSNHSESFHNWSENSRWLMLASKRIDGLITIPFFSYIDEKGQEHKPFALPVKDPLSLKTNLFNYNRPVFVKNEVIIDQNEIRGIVKNTPEKILFDTLNVELDAIAGPTINPVKEEKKGNPYMEK